MQSELFGSPRDLWPTALAMCGLGQWTGPQFRQLFASVETTRIILDITFEESEIPDIGTPGLDRLQVFQTVVKRAVFAAAGRRLRRTTSAVSYTIANLEMQLGIALFERERTR
jgi:hypothetical protein